MFRVIILGYHRQLFSQLLFMMVNLFSSEIFRLFLLLRFIRCSSVRSFKNDPLIISVVRVFCAYRLCISRHASASGLTMSMFSSACILSSSALLYFFLVPIVLRELVVTVVCSPENFDSFASSITVERLPGFVFVIHISGIFAEFWSLVESPTDSSNLELFVSLLQD